MRYLSTRGRAPEAGFADILLSGLAEDGGLYVPAFYPKVSGAELAMWRRLPYDDLAANVIGKFVGPDAVALQDDELRKLCRATYTATTFGYGRADSDASRIAPLNPPMYEKRSRLLRVTWNVCIPPIERPAIAR